jgi:hypothetical protein
MLKRKAKIWLVGLMCVSFVSGFSTVICHGSNGHIAVEPIIHDHCECSETDQNSKESKFAGTTVESSIAHEHCRDLIAAPNVLLPKRKNVKPATHKIFTAKLHLKSNLVYTPSFFNSFATQSDQVILFYTPLRTVILLA